MDTHPIGLNIEGHKAFYERAYSHTVGVVRFAACQPSAERNSAFADSSA